MNFKLPTPPFLAALRLASGIADRRSTMPILAMVCLRVDGKALTVVGTDLNLTALTTIPLTGGKPGGLCVNAKALHDIVANLPGDEVSIEQVENNWAEIKAKKVKYRVVGLPDRDYPKVPDCKEATFAEVDAAALASMLARTLPSVCNDETRFHLNGVLFESDGATARMVSTDGHRLSKVDRTLGLGKLATGVIIPKKGALEIKKLLDAAKVVELAVRPPYLFLRRDGAVLAVKLIDAQFPPYEQVIPKAHTGRAIVDAPTLREAVKRGSLMTTETSGLKLSFADGLLTITSSNPDVGEAREEIECEYEGAPIVLGLAAKYVADIMPLIGDAAVAIELNGPLDPVAFKPVDDPEGFVGVVMPMRV